MPYRAKAHWAQWEAHDEAMHSVVPLDEARLPLTTALRARIPLLVLALAALPNHGMSDLF